MKTLLIGWYVLNGALTPGTIRYDSELACMTTMQRVEDGEAVAFADENGVPSTPPLVLAVCVDPLRRIAQGVIE